MNALIKQLEKEKIALMGLGSENYSLLVFLRRIGCKPNITIHDARSAATIGDRYEKLKKNKNIEWRLGDMSGNDLKDFSLILRSPGAFFSPVLRRSLAKAGTRVLSPMQLFLDLCPSKNIIGVTGTKGKGTTASLIAAILKAGGKKTWLGGNIGIAPFDFMSKIQKKDWVVLELSSFQLEDMSSSPRIAVFTNFSPEHLVSADAQNPNHHVSLKAYWNAKLNIARFQNKSGLLIANRSLATRLNREKLTGKIIYFDRSALPSRLPGEHNKENIAAAHITARTAGISAATIARTVASFKGLHYRLEKVGQHNGITYYNDSFATTPASTITALASFPEPVILIAGGADKGSDFAALAQHIKRRTAAVILFKGKGSDKIRRELRRLSYPSELLREAGSMAEAVELARLFAVPGDIILMSPACASFGLFKNYKDRGEQFNRFAGKK